MSTTLSLAVCLFPGVTALDFTGPMELLCFLTAPAIELGFLPTTSPYLIDPIYLSTSRDPVTVPAGFTILPAKSYDEVTEQYDILLVPGGHGTRPETSPKVLEDFIRKQTPNAKYVLSVCTGSEVLARAGVLEGKRATTNKASFKRIVSETRDLKVTWVPKARWVVDGKLWTASGVTAGADMGHAFLEHLAGAQIANHARGIVELGIHKQDDDEFAEFYNLV